MNSLSPDLPIINEVRFLSWYKENNDDDELKADVIFISFLNQFFFLIIDRREINRNLAQQLKAKLNLDDNCNVDRSEEQQKQNEQFDSSLTTNNHHGKCCLLCVFSQLIIIAKKVEETRKIYLNILSFIS
jgi:hypothetical protein